MALTPAKLQHIKNNVRRTFLGRAQTVNLTRKLPDGTTTLLQLQAILRPAEDNDPDFDPAGSGDDARGADANLQINLADISLADLRSVIYVELPPGAPGANIANRYIPTSIAVKGLVPGGTRYLVSLDRSR